MGLIVGVAVDVGGWVGFCVGVGVGLGAGEVVDVGGGLVRVSELGLELRLAWVKEWDWV